MLLFLVLLFRSLWAVCCLFSSQIGIVRMVAEGFSGGFCQRSCRLSQRVGLGVVVVVVVVVVDCECCCCGCRHAGWGG